MSTNIFLGAKFTLLGADLSAGYEKTSDGYKILISPCDTSKNEGMTIGDVVKDIKSLFGANPPTDLTPDAIESKIKSGAETNADFDIQSVRLKLSTVYLKVVKKGDQTTTDYAFRFDITATDLIPESIQLINISTITIAIWNTTNEGILEQLSLTTDI